MSNETSDNDQPTEPTTLISRRSALRSGSLLAGAGVVTGAGLWYSSKPVMALEGGVISSGDVVLTNNQQDVTGVVIQPELTIDYENISSGVDSVQIVVTADITAGLTKDQITQPPNASTVVTSWGSQTSPTGVEFFNTQESATVAGADLDASALASDQVSQTNPGADVLFASEVDLTADAGIGDTPFPQGVQDDEAAASEVTLTYDATLNTTDGDTGAVTDTKTTTYQVVVDNPASDSDLSGSSITSGSGSDGT